MFQSLSLSYTPQNAVYHCNQWSEHSEIWALLWITHPSVQETESAVTATPPCIGCTSQHVTMHVLFFLNTTSGMKTNSFISAPEQSHARFAPEKKRHQKHEAPCSSLSGDHRLLMLHFIFIHFALFKCTLVSLQ